MGAQVQVAGGRAAAAVRATLVLRSMAAVGRRKRGRLAPARAHPAPGRQGGTRHPAHRGALVSRCSARGGTGATRSRRPTLHGSGERGWAAQRVHRTLHATPLSTPSWLLTTLAPSFWHRLGEACSPGPSPAPTTDLTAPARRPGWNPRSSRRCRIRATRPAAKPPSPTSHSVRSSSALSGPRCLLAHVDPPTARRHPTPPPPPPHSGPAPLVAS